MQPPHELFQWLTACSAEHSQFHHVHPACSEFVLGDLALAPPGPFGQIPLRDASPLTRRYKLDNEAVVSLRT